MTPWPLELGAHTGCLYQVANWFLTTLAPNSVLVLGPLNYLFNRKVTFFLSLGYGWGRCRQFYASASLLHF